MEAERCSAVGGQTAPERPPANGSVRLEDLTKNEAWKITGGLSRTTKMPCHSWGLPASTCKTGAGLATLEGTVCTDCYARKGNYAWPRVQQANQRRYQHATYPAWEDAMATLIRWQAEKNEQPYFRWFDTGDLQSSSMLDSIANVAHNTPEIQHWLPTKEHRMVRDYLTRQLPPPNLTLRLSAHYVDGEPPRLLGSPTSTVHRFEAPVGYSCSAYKTQPTRCGDCRSCWDRLVRNVSYPYH